jgi:radical SAM superfamily enzyme YgiQ (UPF0313 family)
MKILFAVEDIFIIEPLGIMQMIAVAKGRGHECLFDTYGRPDFIDTVKGCRPDVVAISIMSISDESCKSIVKKIKNYDKDIFVIVGGPHTTYYPEFVNNPEVDAICVGEGDEAFIDVLNALEAGRHVNDIPNICTKSSRTPPRCLAEDLDALPHPDRELVYKSTGLGKAKLKSFMVTRGCPYSCTYCFNSGYKKLYTGKGRLLRRRSVDSLIEEIKAVKAGYPLELIRFGDDVFIERMGDWLMEFTEKYSNKIRLPFYCLLSPKVVTQEMAWRLKAAGCVSVAMSIESGNEKIRYGVLQRRISNDEIIKSCRILVDNGIKTFTNIMVGLPQTTIKDDLDSLDVAFKSRTTCVSMTIFTPFPGTVLYEQCVRDGLIPKANTPVFPRSTTDRSLLSCFSEKEKDTQKNIVLLGVLANGSRLLRGIILKRLIHMPPNKAFFYISFVVRNYYNYRHIWPMSLTVGEFLKYVRLVLRHDKKYIE